MKQNKEQALKAIGNFIGFISSMGAQSSEEAMANYADVDTDAISAAIGRGDEVGVAMIVAELALKRCRELNAKDAGPTN